MFRKWTCRSGIEDQAGHEGLCETFRRGVHGGVVLGQMGQESHVGETTQAVHVGQVDEKSQMGQASNAKQVVR